MGRISGDWLVVFNQGVWWWSRGGFLVMWSGARGLGAARKRRYDVACLVVQGFRCAMLGCVAVVRPSVGYGPPAGHVSCWNSTWPRPGQMIDARAWAVWLGVAAIA